MIHVTIRIKIFWLVLESRKVIMITAQGYPQ